MTSAVFGWLAAVVSMSLLWPQVWLSCARRRTEGLSPTATWLAASLPVGWLTYGLLIGDRIQVATNLVNGTAAISILAALLATQPTVRRPRALATSGWAAVALIMVVAAAAIAATNVPAVHPKAAAQALGSVLAVVGLLSALPQPLALLRDGRRNVSGLAPARWWLGLCSGSLWTVYGLETGQSALCASAVFGLACTSVVCVFLIRAARTAATTVESVVTHAPTAPARRTPMTALPAAGADHRRLATTVAA